MALTAAEVWKIISRQTEILIANEIMQQMFLHYFTDRKEIQSAAFSSLCPFATNFWPNRLFWTSEAEWIERAEQSTADNMQRCRCQGNYPSGVKQGLIWVRPLCGSWQNPLLDSSVRSRSERSLNWRAFRASLSPNRITPCRQVLWPGTERAILFSSIWQHNQNKIIG